MFTLIFACPKLSHECLFSYKAYPRTTRKQTSPDNENDHSLWYQFTNTHIRKYETIHFIHNYKTNIHIHKSMLFWDTQWIRHIGLYWLSLHLKCPDIFQDLVGPFEWRNLVTNSSSEFITVSAAWKKIRVTVHLTALGHPQAQWCRGSRPIILYGAGNCTVCVTYFHDNITFTLSWSIFVIHE